MFEDDLGNVARWCCESNLLINPDKTKLLFIGTRQLLSGLFSTPIVSFLGNPLRPAAHAHAKDLAVIFYPHLTYKDKEHVSKVFSSCYFKLCQINRVKASCDSKTLLLISSSLVFSEVFCCSSVWPNTSATK